MLLSEFDEERNAIINPIDCINNIDGFPSIAITCFSGKLFKSIVDSFDGEVIGVIGNADIESNIYKINYNGIEVAFFQSRVGAPACIASYEELIAHGITKCIVFGTCGVLDSSIDELSIIIPTSAIRDEGTSYHYMKDSLEVDVNTKYIEEFEDLLRKCEYSYTIGKTWTTDAFYRETNDKLRKRREMGAICVDMECSALSAVSKFRGIDLFIFFYAADKVEENNWDMRNLECGKDIDKKASLGLLALEFAYIIKDK